METVDFNVTNTFKNDSHFQSVWNSYFQFYKYGIPFFNVTSLIGCVGLLFLLVWHRKTIRYPFTTNLAICCLLAADICYLVAANLLYLGKVKIIQQRVRDINEKFCHIVVIAVAITVYCQCYIQCIISIERYIAVRRPFKVKLWITRKRMVLALFLCLAASIAAAIVAMPLGFRYRNHKCEINPRNGFHMALLAFFTVTAVPGLILMVCTIGIITTVLSRMKYSSRQKSVVSARLRPAEVRLALMLVVMDIIFLIMGIPYAFFTYLVWMVEKLTPAVMFAWDLSLLFTSLGAFTDWIVIFALGSQIRLALRACNRRLSRASVPAGSSSRTSELRQLEELRRITL